MPELATAALVCNSIDLLRRAEHIAFRLQTLGMGEAYVPQMVTAFGKLGHLADAVRLAELSAEGDVRAQAFAALADLHIERADRAAALDALNAAVRILESDTSARYDKVYERLLRLSVIIEDPSIYERIVALMVDEEPSSLWRADLWALRALAAVQHARAGAADLGARCAEIVEEIAAQDEPPWADDFLRSVARLAEAALWDPALKAAACIPDPSVRNEALASVAERMFAQGEEARARDVVRTALATPPPIAPELSEITALAALGFAMADAGDVEGARQVAIRTSNRAAALQQRSARAEGLARSAKLAQHVGEHDIAVDSVGRALGFVNKGKWIQLLDGFVPAVLGAAAAILDDQPLDDALSVVDDKWKLARAAVAEITQGLIRSGRRERAARYVEMIRAQQPDEPPWNQAVTGEVFVQLGDLQDPAMLEWITVTAPHLRDAGLRARALGMAAATLWKTGRRDDAERTLQEALEQVADAPEADRALTDVARELALAGACSRAVDLGRRVLSLATDASAIRKYSPSRFSIAIMGTTARRRPGWPR